MVSVPVNVGRLIPLAVSPLRWSRIIAVTPPWTSPGGPSKAAPRTMSACARPSSVCTTVIGGAIALWAPITALPQCQARRSEL